jgi:hypothetical protein
MNPERLELVLWGILSILVFFAVIVIAAKLLRSK